MGERKKNKILFKEVNPQNLRVFSGSCQARIYERSERGARKNINYCQMVPGTITNNPGNRCHILASTRQNKKKRGKEEILEVTLLTCNEGL